jgi:hypothetical protein
MSEFSRGRAAFVGALALAALMAGAAKADVISGSSVIFTDRGCTVASNLSCVLPSGPVGPS